MPREGNFRDDSSDSSRSSSPSIASPINGPFVPSPRSAFPAAPEQAPRPSRGDEHTLSTYERARAMMANRSSKNITAGPQKSTSNSTDAQPPSSSTQLPVVQEADARYNGRQVVDPINLDGDSVFDQMSPPAHADFSDQVGFSNDNARPPSRRHSPAQPVFAQQQQQQQQTNHLDNKGHQTHGHVFDQAEAPTNPILQKIAAREAQQAVRGHGMGHAEQHMGRYSAASKLYGAPNYGESVMASSSAHAYQAIPRSVETSPASHGGRCRISSPAQLEHDISEHDSKYEDYAMQNVIVDSPVQLASEPRGRGSQVDISDGEISNRIRSEEARVAHNLHDTEMVSFGHEQHLWNKLYQPEFDQFYSDAEQVNELVRGVKFNEAFEAEGKAFSEKYVTHYYEADDVGFSKKSRPLKVEEGEEFDAFWSYRWKTGRFRMWCSILAYYNGVPALIITVAFSWIVFLCLGFVTDPVNSWLPHITDPPEIADPDRINGRWWILSWLAPMVFGLLIMFYSVVFRRNDFIFIDKHSVAQLNPSLAAAGIRALPASLSKCKQLICYVDDEYFTRLWTCYEIAAYLRIRKNPDVRIVNVYIQMVIFWFCITSIVEALILEWMRYLLDPEAAFCAFAAASVGMDCSDWSNEEKLVNGLLVIMCTVTVALQFWIAFMYFEAAEKLQKQAKEFDVRNASIFDQEARNILIDSIATMFSDEAPSNHQFTNGRSTRHSEEGQQQQASSSVSGDGSGARSRKSSLSVEEQQDAEAAVTNQQIHGQKKNN